MICAIFCINNKKSERTNPELQIIAAHFFAIKNRLTVFWERTEERNKKTATLYNNLGMAEYEAIEVFVKMKIQKQWFFSLVSISLGSCRVAHRGLCNFCLNQFSLKVSEMKWF